MNVSRTIVVVALACVLVALHVAPGRADIIGPQLTKGTFEIAIQNRCIDRSLYTLDGPHYDFEQRDAALIFRWAISEFATIGVEGMTGTDPLLSGEDDLQAFYLVGGAAQATLWRNDRFIVSGAIQYTRAFRRWEDQSQPDQLDDSFSWHAMVQTDFSVARQTLTVFAGPVYSREELAVLETISRPRVNLYPVESWGGIAGAVILLGGHATLNGQVLWVENPQLRLGVGYRF